MKRLIFFIVFLCLQTVFGEHQEIATTEMNKDLALCDEAKKDPENKWITYKEKFPNGKCAKEAETYLDKKGCEIARRKQTIMGWQQYLDLHPNGICANLAKHNIENLSKEAAEKKALLEAKALAIAKLAEAQKAMETAIKSAEKAAEEADAAIKALKETKESKKSKKKINTNNLQKQWSTIYTKTVNWNEARTYCRTLTEGNYTDWRLPNIDELRTLIRNCSKTETGGDCQVGEENNCLSFVKCSDSCECSYNSGAYYSNMKKNLKEATWLWSSSNLQEDTNQAWGVNFYGAAVVCEPKINKHYVRCIR